MAHWPRTVLGKLLALLVAVSAASFIWVAIALTGLVIGSSIAILALTSVALFMWYRTVQTAHNITVDNGFSFGNAVRRMRANDALARTAEASERSARSARSERSWRSAHAMETTRA
jgi:hypothetical protein